MTTSAFFLFIIENGIIENIAESGLVSIHAKFPKRQGHGESLKHKKKKKKISQVKKKRFFF